MDATERERLAALAEAATPGPWRVLHVHTPSTPTLDTPDLIAVTSDDLPDGYEVARVSTDYEDDPADVLADAAFIAAARQAVPALLAEVERLTSKYEEWDSMHAACEGLRGDLARVEAALAEAEAEVERLRAALALQAEEVESASQDVTDAERVLADERRQRAEVTEWLSVTRTERDAARAALDRVRALHVHRHEGTDGFDPFCGHCLTDWPCLTVRATEGADGDVPMSQDRGHDLRERITHDIDRAHAQAKYLLLDDGYREGYLDGLEAAERIARAES